MARIKKKGLDYFPLNTDFIHDRAVRRLMKREGDSALGILIEVLSYIYAGEGYYVRADRLFYEDLSAGLYEKSADDVERVIRLAVEYGLFDSGLFERERILTSVEIQRQYLFSTRRRSVSHLEAAYCLLANEEVADNKTGAGEKAASESGKTECEESITGGDNVTFIPENVTSSTHSIAQNSTAQHSIAQQSKAKNTPSSILPWNRQGRRPGGRRKERRFLLQVPAVGRVPVPSSRKNVRRIIRRKLSTRFLPLLTGRHATMRGCLIISVATVSRPRSNMR